VIVVSISSHVVLTENLAFFLVSKVRTAAILVLYEAWNQKF